MSEDLAGTLKDGEAHPSAFAALEWLKLLPMFELIKWQSAFSSCAISGNRLAEICSETLRRLMDGEPVSDRYILGLAWSMKYGIGKELKESRATAPGSKGKKQSKAKVKRVGRAREVCDTETSGS